MRGASAEGGTMKRAFFRTAFVLVVVTLTLVLLVPTMIALEALVPARRGPDGLYRGRDRLWWGFLPISLCIWIADRAVSSLFRSARISDGRWSVFKMGRP